MRARFSIESMHGMPEITLGITGLSEILCWDNGIEEPCWGLSQLDECSISMVQKLVVEDLSHKLLPILIPEYDQSNAPVIGKYQLSW